MAEVVYMLGAGINCGIKNWGDLQPPLATNFFQQALKHSRVGSKGYRKKLEPLFNYIEEYWKLSIDELTTNSFDLEACFTFIELQKREANKENDRELILKLNEIEYRLTIWLAEYLSDFQHFTLDYEPFKCFGEIIYMEKPAVLTFNYDTLLEEVIESASKVNGNVPDSFINKPPEDFVISDEEITYSHFNWNRPLAYGVKFDEVQLHRAGIQQFVSKERFYSHPKNELYKPPILKLHGSLNWFIHTGLKKYSFDEDENKFEEEKRGKTVLFRGNWWFNEPPELNGYIVEPLLVTPVLYKDFSQNFILNQIWQQASEELKDCKKIIVGGYSFPPTDFYTKKLFLEAFSKNTLEEIIVINPDTSVVKLVKNLCHYNKPVVVCEDLEEYIELYY